MNNTCPICEKGTLQSLEGRGEWGENGPSMEYAHSIHYTCGHSIACPSKGFWETVLETPIGKDQI